MKCFYCSNDSDPDVPGNCSGCDRDLKKYCESCEIKFAEDANFCMQCGAKLFELTDTEIEIEEEEEEVFILEEISEAESPEKDPEGTVELDFGIEEQESAKKEVFHAQGIELDGSVPPPGIGADQELKLDLENKTTGKIDESLLKEPEPNVEDSQGFISPNAPKTPENKKKKRTPKQTREIKEKFKGEPLGDEKDAGEEDVDLDSLFDELSTVEKIKLEDENQYDVEPVESEGQKLSEAITGSSDVDEKDDFYEKVEWTIEYPTVNQKSNDDWITFLRIKYPLVTLARRAETLL